MIENKINHKKYIGQSKRIEKRWKEHIIYAAKNKRNSHLYNAFNKYGIENFTFSIIEQCNICELNKKEKYWIQYYNTYIDGYNETTGGDANYEVSKETRKKLSIARNKNKKLISNITKRCWQNENYRKKVMINREKAQQNAKPVLLYESSNINPIEFSTIWQCCLYLLNDKKIGKDIEQIRSNVRKHLKRNSKTFMGLNIQIRYK